MGQHTYTHYFGTQTFSKFIRRAIMQYLREKHLDTNFDAVCRYKDPAKTRDRCISSPKQGKASDNSQTPIRAQQTQCTHA